MNNIGTKKALYVSYDGILEPIGVSQVVNYLVGLAATGIRFTLVSFEKPSKLRDATAVEAMKARLKAGGIRWIPLKYHKRPRLPATAWDILAGVVVGLYVYARYGYTVIHSRSFVASVTAWALKSLTGARFIYDVRGFWSDERLMGGTLNEGDALCSVIKRLEKTLLARADRVVVLAEKAKAYLPEFGLENYQKVTNIPCCVADGFKYSAEGRQRVRDRLGLGGKFVALHAGSLEKWYIMDRMLECFSVIREMYADAVFLVLTSMKESAIRPHLDALGIAPESVMLSAVDYSQMPDYISAADVGLFFLKTPPAAAGFSPVKLGEYLGCGLPIISNTGIGDMDEMFSRYKVGALVTRYDRGEYVRAIRETLDLKRDSAALALECRRAVRKELSLEIGVRRYYEIYKSLAGASEI
jgi:glycosyltransferase involved in cell wall biosynthesis